MTQEVLAERCELSADTIRRLEHGNFSPSLETLQKLCGGLELRLSTLFESYELLELDEGRMLLDLLHNRPMLLRVVTAMVRSMVDALSQGDDITLPSTASERVFPC